MKPLVLLQPFVIIEITASNGWTCFQSTVQFGFCQSTPEILRMLIGFVAQKPIASLSHTDEDEVLTLKLMQNCQPSIGILTCTINASPRMRVVSDFRAEVVHHNKKVGSKFFAVNWDSCSEFHVWRSELNDRGKNPELQKNEFYPTRVLFYTRKNQLRLRRPCLLDDGVFRRIHKLVKRDDTWVEHFGPITHSNVLARTVFSSLQNVKSNCCQSVRTPSVD